MEVSFQISREEQRELQRLTDRRAAGKFGPGWLANGYWWVFLPVAIVGLGFGYGRFDIVVVCFVVFYVLAEGTSYIWRQLYEGRLEEKSPREEQWTVIIDDGGLTLAAAESRAWYAWKSFVTVEKTANYILVHHGEGGGFVYVPRRAFARGEDCDAFSAHLVARIPKQPV